MAPNPQIFPSCYFQIKVPDYDTIGMFTTCTGLEIEFEVFQYAEGGNHEFVYQLPGNLRYPNLVLTRGMTDAKNLREWVWKTRAEPELKELTIEFRDQQQKVLQTWTFNDAFPVRWHGPSFGADSMSIATETLEIAHGGLKGG
jgi:phage tail-like protein